MVRAPFYDKGLKKGAWSREEDERLRAYIQKHGHANWRLLPKIAGLARCGKSCRLRWLNYLRPNLKHGNYTREEEELIFKLHHQFGNKWSLIAEKLHGRSDNEVKNYWHSHLKKCSKGYDYENTISKLESKKIDNLEENATHQIVRPESPASTNVDDFPHILESSTLMSSETSEGDNYSPTSTIICPNTKRDNFAPSVTLEQFNGDFWTEPFIVEDTYTRDEICSSEDISLMISNFYDDIYLFQNLEDFA